MQPWDMGAAGRLDQIIDVLASAGVLGMLREEIAAVWSHNIDRHDPGWAGDTALSLGILSAENINSRVLRRCLPRSPLATAGVNVSLPDQSLLIQAGGIEMHVMKVPGVQAGAPDWHGDFRWGSSSETRRRCAERNSGMYQVTPRFDSWPLFPEPESVRPATMRAGASTFFWCGAEPWTGRRPAGWVCHRWARSRG